MYKVKCTLFEFIRDEKEHPCHFNYKIGDEIYYDGVYFTGRICPSLISTMMPIVNGVFLLGHKFTEDIVFRYRGYDVRDPEMEKYDGIGFRAADRPENAAPSARERNKPPDNPVTGRSRGHHFFCGDQRTLAHFSCEPVDLSDSDYAQPFYRREIAILEIIESEPGIKTDEIIDRFTDFQKNEISPRLTPVLFDLLLEALEDMRYIDIIDGKAYATGREPPSRPSLH